MPTIIRLYASITALIGLVQVVYNALWIGAEAPPFRVHDLMIASELAWMFVSIDLGVRLRRRRLPISVPLSYVLYSAFTIGYSSWLASTLGIGNVTDEVVPLWFKLGAIGVGAWFIAGSAGIFVWVRAAEEAAE